MLNDTKQLRAVSEQLVFVSRLCALRSTWSLIRRMWALSFVPLSSLALTPSWYALLPWFVATVVPD
jgi:hypothetical protein